MTDTICGLVPNPLPVQTFVVHVPLSRKASAYRMGGCIISPAGSRNRWLPGSAARPICKFPRLARGFRRCQRLASRVTAYTQADSG